MTKLEFQKKYKLSDLEYEIYSYIRPMDLMNPHSLRKIGSGESYLNVEHPIHPDIEILIATGLHEDVVIAVKSLIKKDILQLYGNAAYWRYGQQGQETFFVRRSKNAEWGIGVMLTLTEKSKKMPYLFWIWNKVFNSSPTATP